MRNERKKHTNKPTLTQNERDSFIKMNMPMKFAMHETKTENINTCEAHNTVKREVCIIDIYENHCMA